MSALSKVRTTAPARAGGGPGGGAVDGGVDPAGASADCATIGEASTVIGSETQPTMSARTAAIGSNLDRARLSGRRITTCGVATRPSCAGPLQRLVGRLIASGARTLYSASTARRISLPGTALLSV